MKKIILVVSLFLISLLFLVVPAFAATTTVVVSPNSTNGWVFNPDLSNSTPYEFTTDAYSMGIGSLYIEPIDAIPVHKFIAIKPLGTLVSDVNFIAYDFKIAGSGTIADADQFYLNVYTNLPNSDTYYDCRFDYVPTTGSTSSFTTAMFNSTDTPVNVRAKTGVTCPSTLAEMTEGSKVSFIALNVGDTSASDTGLAGYLDNVVVDTTSGATTYDLEPSCVPIATDKTTNGPATAAVVVTSNENISGDVNALGCDVGVYVPHVATNVTVSAKIHDANQYGVFNDGNVTVSNSEIYKIGNHNGSDFEPNGVQTGVGVYFDYYSDVASGTITHSNIHHYQKGGIVISGQYSTAAVMNNIVTGLGPFKWIAQNGIQFGYGATALSLTGNTVSDNIYTQGGDPGWVSTGILFYQGNLNGVTKSNQVLPTIQKENKVFRNQANVTVIN